MPIANVVRCLGGRRWPALACEAKMGGASSSSRLEAPSFLFLRHSRAAPEPFCLPSTCRPLAVSSEACDSAAMDQEVCISTGARLHFGLLAVTPPQGRSFGGIGVMIDSPGYELRCRVATTDLVRGPSPADCERVHRYLERIRSRSRERLPQVAIAIEQEIPAHGGLGSGTQLGLSTALGLLTLAGIPRPPAVELAGLVQRGQRSAIGVHGFDHGGLLVEGGKQQADAVSSLVARATVPSNWRWVLITPRRTEGLSGIAEQQAFRQLPPSPTTLTGQLCQLLLMDWLPAVHEADFEAASRAMWEYGQLVGNYFAVVQGGPFADRQMAQLASELRARGYPGIAQTSWGPTIAVLCAEPPMADRLTTLLHALPGAADCEIRSVSTLSTGARLKILDTACR